MDLLDSVLWSNWDWYPCYLSSIFDKDSNDFEFLWNSEVADSELMMEMDNYEQYCPVVEA